MQCMSGYRDNPGKTKSIKISAPKKNILPQTPKTKFYTSVRKKTKYTKLITLSAL